ncbi:MAG: polysaccharide biosynthesis C-terminal domain-containing protein [Chloroflexota bacterium]|nr:polysaccharide biosynthesis C-terminal domain-containing protein [Chloroflexota bacterium]
MTLTSPFARRVMGVFATRVVRFVLGFAISFTLARILGPSGRGVYSIATLTPTTLVNLGHLGLPNAFSFFAGRGRSGARMLRLGLLMSAVLSAALIGLTLIALPVLSDTLLRAASYDLLLLAIVAIPFQLAAAFAGATLIGRQTMRNYNVILIGQTVLMLVMIVTLVGILDLGVMGAVIATIVVGAATAVATTLELRRAVAADPDDAVRPGVRIRELGSFGAKIYPASLAGFFGYRADVFLLSALLGDPRAIGLYTLGVSLAELTFFVPDAVSTVFFPRVAGMQRESADEKVAAVTRFTVLITLIATALLIPAATLAVNIVLPDFRESLAPFLVLLPGIICLTVAKVLASYVGGLGIPLRVALASGSALAVNIIANLVLIPPLGIMGAALASLISYTINATLLLTIASRLSRRPPLDFVLPTRAELSRLRDGLREAKSLLQDR